MSIGHWLHEGSYSHELDLTVLLTLTGASSEQFLSRHAAVVEAAYDAALPFHFAIIPTALGLRIQCDRVAVLIAYRTLEQFYIAALGEGPLAARSQRRFRTRLPMSSGTISAWC